MADGFLGYHASFMLDVVVCALVLIVPAIAFSLYLVKVKKNYVAHRNLQLTLGVVLLLAVSAFEIDIRLHGGWEAIVNRPGSEARLTGEELKHATQVLWVHLLFAISTPPLWIATIVLALRRFPNPPVPSEHSELHKKLGWLSTLDIALTSVTGLYWYYIAFVT
jgi:hypothetical protein